MSNFEFGVCGLEEYSANEKNRVYESNLSIGGLYTIMFLLDGDSAQAAKFPVRLEDVDFEDVGKCVVDLIILDADLAPDLNREAVFQGGYWQRAGSEGVSVAEATATSGYLRDYVTGIDNVFEEIYSMDVEVPVLMSA